MTTHVTADGTPIHFTDLLGFQSESFAYISSPDVEAIKTARALSKTHGLARITHSDRSAPCEPFGYKIVVEIDFEVEES